MSIKSLRNQYRGVNAHLHSQFQTRGGPLSQWPSFHSGIITHTVETLNAVLPLRYRAVGEQSLQVIKSEETTHGIRRPDVTIYQSGAGPKLAAVATAESAWIATIEETLTPVDELFAVIVYDQDGPRQHEHLGTPVTRIELLSASNKSGGGGFDAYLMARREALLGGLPLVEIVLLHESGSPVLTMPAYPHDANSYPYHITISDPRRPVDGQQVRDFGIRVDQAFPVVQIPLADNDEVAFDLNTVYEQTFAGGRWGQQIDYALPPERMDSYTSIDQQQIIARLSAIADAVKQELDLEKGPF